MTYSLPMTIKPEDLERLRTALVRERNLLVAAEQERAAVARGGADGEIEDGDVAERMIVQEDALRIAALDTQRFEDIESALRRIEDGTYGFSALSGAPIPLERLEVVPWARLTVEEEERRQRD
jgi:DnaK suppressor protein